MGGGTTDPTDTGMQPQPRGQATPNLFQPYQKYMPSEYYGSDPINNPNNILSAYSQHMPAFLQASRSTDVDKSGTPYIPPAPQGGNIAQGVQYATDMARINAALAAPWLAYGGKK